MHPKTFAQARPAKLSSRSFSLAPLLAPLLACAALALAGPGCSLIKINGKPLGGSGGGASASSSPAGADGESSESPSSARAEVPTAQSPLCKASSGAGGSTLAELDDALKTKDDFYAAVDLVDALCTTDGELARERGRVRALGKAWMDKLHVDERDLSALYLTARGRPSDRQDLDSFGGAIGQYARLTGEVIGSMEMLDQLGARASALARVAVVRSCFKLGLEVYQPQARYPLLLSVLCTRESIDLAGAEQEIDAEPELNDITRYYLRRDAWRASEAVRQARASLIALAKEEPGVANLVAIADQEFKQWASPSPKRAALMAQLSAMEAASASSKRSAFAGCQDKTLAAWVEVVSALKLPPAPDKHQVETYLHATLSTAEGYLAYTALRLCSAAAEEGLGLRFEAVSTSRVRRGPRTSTVATWGALDEAIEFDDRNLTFAKLIRELPLRYESGYVGEVRAGVISRIAPVDGGVQVTFKTVREPRVSCMNWVRTNRILRIDDSGNLIYEERCTSYGTAMWDLTAAPVKFGKAMAQGLTPGLFLVALDGMPVVATRSPSSSAPVFVLGASLR